MGKAGKVSMADIARHLDISQAMVSYVLSGRSSGAVNARMRERVLTAAREMGYRPNRAAQVLKGGNSHIIELYIGGFYPSYFSHVLDAFDEQLHSTPYELRIVNPAFKSEEEWALSKGEWPVDGIITDVALPEVLYSSLKQRDTPIVSVGNYAHTEVDHVFLDVTPALLEGIRHLAAQSRRVAFVSMMWPDGSNLYGYGQDARYPAYHQVMQEMSLPEEVIVVHETPGVSLRALTYQTICSYITDHGCPDAFFCFNDDRAIATLAALHDLGLHVPRDVLLLGYDGIEESLYHRPAISTIQYPFQEVARLAWEFLLYRMEHPDAPPQSATLTAQLALRHSSDRQRL